MTSGEKMVDDLKRDHASDSMIAQAKGYQDQLDAVENQHKAMEGWKKDQEEAKKLLEEALTPLQKQADKMKEIQRLYDEQIITLKQAQGLTDKLNQDATKHADPNDPSMHAAAVTRRFDFALPKEQQNGIDLTKQHVELAKLQLDKATLIATDISELRRFGQTQVDNLAVTYDIT
jgi:hypothetical protein